MRAFRHRTAVARKNAVLAEDLADFREGDRVMTIDGVPGRVTGVLFGPYQGTESYQVELDNGMGGGDYAPGQLHKTSPKTSSHVEAAEITAVITDHTANVDYPELEDILERRLPIENITLYASTDLAIEPVPSDYDARKDSQRPQSATDHSWLDQVAMEPNDGDYAALQPGEYYDKTAAVNQDDQTTRPDSSADDSTENLEQDQQATEDNPDDVPDTDSDDPDSEVDGEPGEGQDAELGDVTMPSACSYCGGSSFGDTQMTGRGVRTRCDQCGGTMKSWGGQWEPEFPNSSQNRASEAPDYRSGGVGGIGNAPGAKPDSTSPDDNALNKLNDENNDDDGKTIKIKVESLLEGMTNPQIAESLQSQAGIVQYLFNRIYEKARKRYEDKQIEWWQPPQAIIGTDLAGPAQYHVVTPQRVSVGSVSEYDDPDWKWHFTASWLDVQAKARRIRKEGHVKIVAASKLYVSAEVLGDQATYETQLNYVPGTRKVADWACGCKWASYAWGRAKRYQRFEGRLCSHALATQYEASARGIFGREVEPNRQRPDWQNASSPVVVQYDKAQGRDLTRRAVPPANMRRTFSSLVLDSDGIYPDPRRLDLQHPPVYASIQTIIDNDGDLTDAIEMLASVGVTRDDAKGMLLEALLSPPVDQGYLGYPDGPESGSAFVSEASVHPYAQQDWYHGGHLGAGTRGDTLHLPLEERARKGTTQNVLHVGTHKSAMDRIDPEQWDIEEFPEIRHARVHKLRLSPGARVCPQIHADDQDAGSLDFKLHDSDKYDVHAYHNTYEDPGNISLVGKSHAFHVTEDLGRHPKWDDSQFADEQTQRSREHHEWIKSQSSKQHPHKKHVTNQEHGVTTGYYGLGPWAWCGMCGGSGCGNCNGTGQVPQSDPSAVGDGGGVDAGGDGGGGDGGGGATASLKTAADDYGHPHMNQDEWNNNSWYRSGYGDGAKGDAHERDAAQARVDAQRHDQADIDYLVGHAHGTMQGRDNASRHHTIDQMWKAAPEYGSVEHQVNMLGHELDHKEADYSTADPLAGMDAGQLTRPTTPHSNSDNPASTGWATSQDPGDWGKSLISNDFGVTFDAALHKMSIEDFDFPESHHVVEYDEKSGRRMMDAPENHSFPTREHAERYVDWLGRKYHENMDRPMPEGRFKIHSPRPVIIEHEPRSNYELPGRTIDAALHTATEPFGSMTEAAADHLARMFDANLTDTPEPALPSTTGEDEEVVPGDDPGNTGQMPGDDAFENTSGNIPGVGLYNTLSSLSGLTEEQRIVAEFQRTAGARAIFKEAAKDFSFEEQQELINEGRGVRARNFNDLQITGTHYELIGDGDDDETILWV